MHKLIGKYGRAALFLSAALIAGGCQKKSGAGPVVARINDYRLTVDDFTREAKLNLPAMLLNDRSGTVKEQLYSDIVTNELILQEAEKMGLDKDKAFMKEIENYWKQALIKRLITIKGKEFMAAVKGGDEASRRKKAQEMLELWVAGLKKDAKIERYDAVLDKIDLSTVKSNKGAAYEE